MNKIRYFLLILVIPLLFSNCEKEDGIPAEPIEFKLRLLNENLEEDTVFNEGENIIFSFYIKNHTSQVALYNILSNDKDFFRVYKTMDGVFDEDYGKAYDAYYPIQYLAYQRISPRGIKEFRVPWISSDNSNYDNGSLIVISENHLSSLPKGTYYTKYKSLFEFGFDDKPIREETKQFKIKFTVK